MMERERIFTRKALTGLFLLRFLAVHEIVSPSAATAAASASGKKTTTDEETGGTSRTKRKWDEEAEVDPPYAARTSTSDEQHHYHTEFQFLPTISSAAAPAVGEPAPAPWFFDQPDYRGRLGSCNNFHYVEKGATDFLQQEAPAQFLQAEQPPQRGRPSSDVSTTFLYQRTRPVQQLELPSSSSSSSSCALSTTRIKEDPPRPASHLHHPYLSRGQHNSTSTGGTRSLSGTTSTSSPGTTMSFLAGGFEQSTLGMGPSVEVVHDLQCDLDSDTKRNYRDHILLLPATSTTEASSTRPGGEGEVSETVGGYSSGSGSLATLLHNQGIYNILGGENNARQMNTTTLRGEHHGVKRSALVLKSCIRKNRSSGARSSVDCIGGETSLAATPLKMSTSQHKEVVGEEVDDLSTAGTRMRVRTTDPHHDHEQSRADRGLPNLRTTDPRHDHEQSRAGSPSSRSPHHDHEQSRAGSPSSTASTCASRRSSSSPREKKVRFNVEEEVQDHLPAEADESQTCAAGAPATVAKINSCGSRTFPSYVVSSSSSSASSSWAGVLAGSGSEQGSTSGTGGENENNQETTMSLSRMQQASPTSSVSFLSSSRSSTTKTNTSSTPAAFSYSGFPLSCPDVDHARIVQEESNQRLLLASLQDITVKNPAYVRPEKTMAERRRKAEETAEQEKKRNAMLQQLQQQESEAQEHQSSHPVLSPMGMLLHPMIEMKDQDLFLKAALEMDGPMHGA
ncbi:unnamed protein product [Amoebophrya sp. A120]|nr:unnamed protein product [Amoebophrya sp. A120]|eukprot:GSA120T00008444001.1